MICKICNSELTKLKVFNVYGFGISLPSECYICSFCKKMMQGDFGRYIGYDIQINETQMISKIFYKKSNYAEIHFNYGKLNIDHCIECKNCIDFFETIEGAGVSYLDTLVVIDTTKIDINSNIIHSYNIEELKYEVQKRMLLC